MSNEHLYRRKKAKYSIGKLFGDWLWRNISVSVEKYIGNIWVILNIFLNIWRKEVTPLEGKSEYWFVICILIFWYFRKSRPFRCLTIEWGAVQNTFWILNSEFWILNWMRAHCRIPSEFCFNQVWLWSCSAASALHIITFHIIWFLATTDTKATFWLFILGTPWVHQAPRRDSAIFSFDWSSLLYTVGDPRQAFCHNTPCIVQSSYIWNSFWILQSGLTLILCWT